MYSNKFRKGKNVCLQEADEDDYNMRDFERVEIELDTTDIKRSTNIKEEIVPKEFTKEDSIENVSRI